MNTALEQLDESLRELEAIFNSAFDGLVMWSGAGYCLRVNAAYERISGGVGAADLNGKSIYEALEQGYISASPVPEVLRTRRRVTVINNNRNGRSILVTGTPVVDETGGVWRVVCDCRDITELVQLQAQLERSSELLHHYQTELAQVRETPLPEGLVVQSRAMSRLIDAALRVARTDSTVLLLGESGVGKDVLAELIHKRSPRSEHPFIRVNCAAVPESLMESEFFGYEKGSFTGARQSGKAGFFELAHRGTIFLDEVAELPLPVQAKLLRVLQDSQVMRVGGTGYRLVDARIVAATNKDLLAMVETGRFRRDLYYRLNVVPLLVPALRERREDILPLLRHFLKLYNDRHERSCTLATDTLRCLLEYDWPGNIRELKNVLERLVVLTEDTQIGVRELPPEMQRPVTPALDLVTTGSLGQQLEMVERAIIQRAVKAHGSVRKAAKVLQVDHSTLVRKLQRQHEG